jgi:hypothetical protein
MRIAWCWYRASLGVFYVSTLLAIHDEPRVPVSYLLFLKNMAFGRTRTEQEEESGTNTEQRTGQFLFNLFQESVEDGFFGGVKWGVAACCYQIFYEFSMSFLGVVPEVGSVVKRVVVNCFNRISRRPPAIDVHTLSVLTHLFSDVLGEFEETLLIKDYDEACRGFHKDAVRSVCIHIMEYLNAHYAHYAGSTSQRQWLVQTVRSLSACDAHEIAFVIVIIVHDLENILKQLDSTQCHKELMHSARAALLAFGKLNMLLVGVRSNNVSQGAQGAWFSGGKHPRGDVFTNTPTPPCANSSVGSLQST